MLDVDDVDDDDGDNKRGSERRACADAAAVASADSLSSSSSVVDVAPVELSQETSRIQPKQTQERSLYCAASHLEQKDGAKMERRISMKQPVD